MRICLVICLASLVTAGSVCDARAQLIEGPQGAVGGLLGGRRPPDPGRDSQSLDVSFDLSGGYDRDPNALFFGSGPEAEELTRWYAGTGGAAVRYRVGSLKRSLDARGHAFMNYQSTAGDPLVGGDGQVNGTARFGPRQLSQLTVQLQSSYQPGWVFGAFGSSSGPTVESGSIGVAPPTGVFEQRWLILSGIAEYQQHWNARHATAIGYDNRRLRPIEGAGLESELQVASIEQRWTASRGITLIGAYRVDQNVQRDANAVAVPSVRYQSVDAGFRYERRRSPVRRYIVTLRGGMTNLFDSPTAQKTEAWHPTFNGMVQVVPSTRFTLTADFARAVTVLAGISVIPVVNDTAALTVTGGPTRKLQYSVLASAARAGFLGQGSSRIATNVVGTTGEVRYAVANWVALFATYGFYHHRIDDPTVVASGLPIRYERHSARIGVTLWLPLYGTF